MLSAVPLSEPPTGSPRKSPAATLPAPWAMKSRDGELRSVSDPGMLWLTPAPCARLTTATAKAPVRTSGERADSAGRAGSGSPPVISLVSPTTCTSSPRRATRTVGTTMATRLATLLSGVRGSVAASPSVSTARPRVGRSTAPRLPSRLTVWATSVPPSGEVPVMVGSWLRISTTAMPVTKPVITEKDMNRRSRPIRSTPKRIISAPASSTVRNSAPSRSSAGTPASD